MMHYEEIVPKLRLALESPDATQDLARLIAQLNRQGATKEELTDWLRRLRKEVASELTEAKEDAVVDTIEFVWRDL
jgi:hypothetical protein